MLSDFGNRVQTGHGVLENHCDFVAADFVEILFRDTEQVLSVINNLSALHHGIAGEDAENGLGCDGLTGTGLAHNRQCLAGMQVEGNVTNGLYFSLSRFEEDGQIFYL